MLLKNTQASRQVAHKSGRVFLLSHTLEEIVGRIFQFLWKWPFGKYKNMVQYPKSRSIAPCFRFLNNNYQRSCKTCSRKLWILKPLQKPFISLGPCIFLNKTRVFFFKLNSCACSDINMFCDYLKDLFFGRFYHLFPRKIITTKSLKIHI